MGCWNETCLMSNLPIRGGEPVVAFLIAHDGFKDEKHSSGTYHATDRVFPITLPIEANYDEYGCIEMFDEQSLALQHINKLFGASLSDIFEAIHDGNITIPSTLGNGDVNVGLVMFHQEIYYTAIDEIASYNKSEMRQQVISAIEAAIAHDQLKNSKVFEKYNLGRPPAMNSFLYRTCSIDQCRKDEYVLNVLEQLMISVLSNNPDNKDKLLDEYANAIMGRMSITSALNKLRKTWTPPSGKGSQGDNVVAHIALANAIKRVAIKDREPEQLYRMFLLDKDY